jgi:condensin complex subunit 2
MDKDEKGTMLTAAALAKEQLSSSTLPRDLNCTPKMLSSLFLKPSATVGRRRRVLRQTAMRVADAVADGPASDVVAHGTASDARDAYSDGGDDVAVYDDFGDEPAAGQIGYQSEVGGAGVHGDGVAAGGMGGSQLELLERPAQVEQIKIGYAKVAKQVDIKGLKSGVWELLHDAKLEAHSSGAAAVSFRKVLGGLASKVPAAQLPDVSFAYCFISLLHLANERGLEVQASEALDDLTVTLPRK